MNMTMFIEYVAFMSLLILTIVFTLRVKNGEEEERQEGHMFTSTLVKRLYDGLVSYGLQPSLQHQVGKYTIDVAFPTVKIAIEAVEHNFLVDADEMDDEWEKDIYLKNHGWTILRFSGIRIEEDLPRVVEKISRALMGKSNLS